MGTSKQASHHVYYFPEFVYDLFTILFLPLNFTIQFLSSRFASAKNLPNYSDSPQLQPKQLRQTISNASPDQLRASLLSNLDISKFSQKKRYPEPELLVLFDSLPGISTTQMIGNWQGNVILSNSWLDLCDRFLVEPISTLFNAYWGKRYRSLHVGDPLIVTVKRPSSKFTFPLPM
jgi:hypothetical protein